MLSTPLIAPPVLSEEIEFPKIQAACTTFPQTRKPINFFFGAADSQSAFDPYQKQQTEQRIRALIDAKQWDEAAIEIQKQSNEFQELFPQLLIAMVEADQANRATQLIVRQFPPRSFERARNVGAIAKTLIQKDQTEPAIALLKMLPQDSEFLSEAISPVAIALQETNQLDQLKTLNVMFRSANAQSQFWLSVGTLQLEPAIAKQITSMIDEPRLRSQTIEQMAMKWLSTSREETITGWTIANEMEDCLLRSHFFLYEIDRASNLKLLNRSEVAEFLDQMTALVNGIDQSKIGDRRALAELRLKFAARNTKAGRKAQATKLLEQVAEDQKRFEFHADRAQIGLSVAAQYRILANPTRALQALDRALAEAQSALRKQENSVVGDPDSPLDYWYRETLFLIAREYRSLNQPRKAAAVEALRPKPAPLPRNAAPPSLSNERQ